MKNFVRLHLWCNGPIFAFILLINACGIQDFVRKNHATHSENIQNSDAKAAISAESSANSVASNQANGGPLADQLAKTQVDVKNPGPPTGSSGDKPSQNSAGQNDDPTQHDTPKPPSPPPPASQYDEAAYVYIEADCYCSQWDDVC
ncbi:MAG: hypothetical protein NTX25_23325, partial [Proteobacteria bacterium]|nr:hypothetical protein [Pseudomonadota bacterium]